MFNHFYLAGTACQRVLKLSDIRKTMTSSGRSATYEASRSEEASHADLAWATMHALLNEPLTAGISTPLTSTILEFY